MYIYIYIIRFFWWGLKDMKVGISVKDLLLYYELLKSLLLLDPRGGFFSQRDMEEAFQILGALAEHKAAFIAFNLNQSWVTTEAGIRRCAYITRVMLSHLRIKYDQFTALGAAAANRAHPQQLQELYALMCDRGGTPADNKPTKRKNPFFAFRESSDDDAEDDDAEVGEQTVVPTEVPTEVLTYFEHDEYRAVMLLSDGTYRNADTYSKGGNGFAVAQWVTGTSMDTEVLNKMINSDGAKLAKPPPPPPPLKRPSSKAKGKAKGKGKAKQKAEEKAAVAADADEDEDAEEEEPEHDIEDEDDPEAPDGAVEGEAGEEEDEAKGGKTRKDKKNTKKRPSSGDATGTSAAAPVGKKKTAAPKKAAPAAKKKAAHAWTQELQQERVSMLPEKARPQKELKGLQQSYTNRYEDHIATVGVLLLHRAFYISPVEVIPRSAIVFGDFAINAKGGVELSYKDVAEDAAKLAELFDIVLAIAKGDEDVE